MSLTVITTPLTAGPVEVDDLHDLRRHLYDRAQTPVVFLAKPVSMLGLVVAMRLMVR
jgi:hypothetical protein